MTKCKRTDCPSPEKDFTEIGIKRHWTTDHGSYSLEDLRNHGMSPSKSDIARKLDSGRGSISDTVEDAPETEVAEEKAKEGVAGTRTRQKKVKISEDEELFNKNRPILVRRWKRRLRIPYAIWAKMLGDPNILLSEEEATEGAEIHVDLMSAMGWFRASKYEAVFDVVSWHGLTVLSRSKFGQNLLKQFASEEQQEEERPN